MPTSAITGRVVPPNNISRITEVTFRAASTVIDGDDVVPVGTKITYNLTPQGELPEEAQLVQNGHYIVLVRMEYSIRGIFSSHNAPIGSIHVGAESSYVLSDLIEN